MEDGNQELLCEEKVVHRELVDRVRAMLPDEDTIYELADLFKIFGDSTRMKILFVLLESELCVCDIAEVLGMNQSAISHQLRILKQAKLVTARRVGKTTLCRLADDHVRSIIDQGMSHVLE